MGAFDNGLLINLRKMKISFLSQYYFSLWFCLLLPFDCSFLLKSVDYLDVCVTDLGTQFWFIASGNFSVIYFAGSCVFASYIFGCLANWVIIFYVRIPCVVRFLIGFSFRLSPKTPLCTLSRSMVPIHFGRLSYVIQGMIAIGL